MSSPTHPCSCDRPPLLARPSPLLNSCRRLLATFATAQPTPRPLTHRRGRDAQVAGLLALACALDAVYMLSLYKAVTLISPVYVAAIKRGGGVLASSLIGATVFGESLRGRSLPVLAISAGVVLLCMK